MATGGKNKDTSKLIEAQRQRLKGPLTPPRNVNALRLFDEFVIAVAVSKDERGDGGRLGAIVALSAVLEWLNAHPLFIPENSLQPLSNLRDALLDLDQGGNPPMLRAQEGRPQLTTAQRIMRAVAAFAVDMLMKSGEAEIAACTTVARELDRQGWRRAGNKPVNATTVQNWRKTVRGGSPAEDDETDHYQHFLTVLVNGNAPGDPGQSALRILQWLADRYPARLKS